MKNLILDGNNLAFRAGFVGEELVNRKGHDVGVIFIFLKMVKSLLSKFEPDRLFVVWDGGTSLWRLSEYEEYKLNKRLHNPISEDMYRRIITQASVLKDIILPNLPVYQIMKEREEADDMICALSQVLFEMGGKREEQILVSTDHDFFQLLDYLSIWDTVKNSMYTKHDFVEEYGFQPQDFVIFRALVGDSSDNLNGVPGVGNVTATKILRRYKSIENFFLCSVPSDAASYTLAYGERVLSDDDIALAPKLKLKNLVDHEDIFWRNVRLIDLLEYPYIQTNKNYIIEHLNGSKLSFFETEYNNFLMHNGLVSLTSNKMEFIQQCNRLESNG